jgi:thiamine biosynthesis lipoprotein
MAQRSSVEAMKKSIGRAGLRARPADFFSTRRAGRDARPPIRIFSQTFLILVTILALVFSHDLAGQPETQTAPAMEPFTRQTYLMGTMLTMTIYGADEATAMSVSGEIIKTVEETEDQLSTWRSTSELSRLNAQPSGKPFPMTDSLCRLMQTLRERVDQTGGAFDPTVGRILQAWGIHQEIRIPTDAVLKNALSNTGFHYYNISLNTCDVVKTRDVLVDAGAFGKGEALDRVFALSTLRDFPPFLLNFGGQIAVWKKPPYNETWVSIIADPQDREGVSRIQVRFTDGSLSTSGQSEQQTWLKGQMVGHIVDPRTGRPVPGFGSVTVWSKSAMEADILSTALFVMGPENGAGWATSHHVAACFLTGKDTVFTPECKSIMTIIIK